MPEPQSLEVIVFIDVAELVAGLGGPAAGPVDWQALPGWLATEAAAAALCLPVESLRYSGAYVHVTDAPVTDTGAAHARADASGDRVAVAAALGAASDVTLVQVRRREDPGECRACEVAGTPRCSRCRNRTVGAGGLGGRAAGAIASELFRLTREDALDVAVLLSSDGALVPVVRFLQGRGKQAVHAAFPPRGRRLSEACAGIIDLAGVLP